MLNRVHSRFGAGLMAFAIVLSNAVMPASQAMAWTADPAENTEKNTKTYICKYVAGADGYVAQTGNNPIARDRNDTDKVGGQVPDNQYSLVVGFGYPSEPQNDQPGVDDCNALIAPGTPTVTPIVTTCTPGTNSTDTASITISNTADLGLRSATYTVSIDGTVFTNTASVADGQQVTVALTGLTVGTHAISITGSDGTTANTSIIINGCTVVTPEPVRVTAVDGTFKDECGPEYNLSFTPATTAGVTYTQTRAGNTLTVTATANEGYELTNPTWSQAMTDQLIACPAVPCTVTPQAIKPIAEGATASYTFSNDGLHLNTPANEDTVYTIFDVGETPLVSIDAMTYKTLRLAKSGGAEHLVPSYFLLIDLNGDEATTDDQGYILYEPFYSYQSGAAPAIQEGVWQTWDAIAGGNAYWWGYGIDSSFTMKWKDILALYPDAVALEFGVNQGTGNPELYSVVQDVTFDCVTIHVSDPGQGGGTPTPETPVTPVTPATPATPVTPAATKAATPLVMPTELPETGATGFKGTLIALIATLATYGAVYFAQGKRRYE